MRDDTLGVFRAFVERHLTQTAQLHDLAGLTPPFPMHVHIEPTNSCNLSCIHCVQGTMQRKRGLMSWEVFQKVIDEIGPSRTAVTLDVQGEPLLHPRAVDMVVYARKAGCHVSLLTNGVKLDADSARRLVAAGLDRIVFSFDAVEKGLYESIRKGADFHKTLLNILNFIQINDESGHPTFVCMSIVRQKATEAHLDDYREYFRRLPVDTVFVSSLLNMSGGSSVSAEIDMAEKKAVPRSESPICRIPWENIVVNWDGSVCPCPLDYDALWPAGNVREQTLREIWEGEPFRRFREAHRERVFDRLGACARLCAECNCRWDPEYDMRRYAEFAREAIVRKFGQLSRAAATEMMTNAAGSAAPSRGSSGALAQEICRVAREAGETERGAR